MLDDLIEIGYGGMGLHPWEFERYTYHQFVAKYKGWERGRADMMKAIDESIRWAAYCQIVPTLDVKYKKLPFDKLVPDRYVKPKPKSTESQSEKIKRHLEASRRLDAIKKQKNAG